MFSELLRFYGAFAAFIIGIMAIAFGLISWTTHYSCESYHKLTGVQTAYYAWSADCYVKTDSGRWVTLNTYTRNVGDVTVRQKKD